MDNFRFTDNNIKQYSLAKPFPHIVIDNFIDEKVLNKVLEEFKSYDKWGHDLSESSKNNQIKKYFSPWNENNVKDIPVFTKLVLDYFNSPEFILQLENLTGIKGLLPDYEFLGGGMHRIDSGGKLSIHIDSNIHSKTGKYRRINLLVYLNKDWKHEWGGGLQLWNEDVTKMYHDIDPIFNRAVIFNTTNTSYHGHPHSLNTPNGISRYSLALYYYSDERPEHEKNNISWAVWKETPQLKKPTICFASMCKNEEHCIKNTLESVYKYIDYWVICDTGSTDKTCQIIQDFFKEKNIPGELFVDEWQGFDKNKTLMIQRAQGKADYIMHLDADDLLVGDFVFNNDEVGKDSYFMTVKRGDSNWKALILFNGNYLWKFCGVAHTTIKCLDKPNITFGDLSHHNYYISGEGIGSRAFDPKKYFYDAEKLQKQFFDTLYDDPDELNTRSVFYTAQSYMDCGMYKEGLQWNKLYTKLKNTWIEEEFEAQMRISKCLMQLGASEFEIEDEMLKAIQIFPDRAEPYFALGVYFNGKENFRKGYDYLKQAKSKSLDAVKQKYVLFINDRCYEKFVNDELSVACYWTDKKEEGIKLIEEIIDDYEFNSIKERLLKNIEHFNNKG